MATKTEGKSESALGSNLGLSRDELLEMYQLMVIARAVDERMWILNRAGKIPFVISGQGHEGAQVGLAYALKKGHDWMVPYYRSVASLMTFGMSPREIMLAQFARGVDPSSGGRQMPGHYGIKDRNILSVSSPVATQILHATGIAWAAKLRKQDIVTITYLGEGSSNQGDFHEALNFAGVHQLPVIYVVENNGYAISVPMALQSAVADIAIRAEGYNMPGIIVDGSDVLNCYAEGRAAIDRARNGQGPTLIEAKVLRLTAHSSDDQQSKYRDAAEIESEKLRDPLPRFRDQLREAGMLDDETEARITAESRKVVEDSTEWAEAQAEPDPATAQQNVYASEPPARMDDPLWNGTRFIGDGGPWGVLADGQSGEG
jgi:2-oxoisovalerate dehydrogenase E1 component alpha subunit